MKLVSVSPRADRDIDALADFMALENLEAALLFLNAVDESLELIAQQPGIGSPRLNHFPYLQGLRVSSVAGFKNHLVFYVVRADQIEVIRVLHSARDLPAALSESDN